jgi:diaminohydroxyphosphoribosylaminopyrimidine deaminase/5-amino-6-(5-phosphoribosylamino)uracil reductase
MDSSNVLITSLDQTARQEFDESMMRKAIAFGLQGQYTSAPNPWVSSIITDPYGNILGQGYHQKAGQPHAEIRAIQSVKDKYGSNYEKMLEGATCYVTLEPCSHTGRTGPCDQQLIKYKFARVVVGLVDPDSNVSGSGIAHLKEAGIEVVTNIARDDCADYLKPYLKHRKTGMPWVVYKMAASLDAKIAAGNGQSQWISNEESRKDAHLRWRATSQAILVGSGTAAEDNPTLNVRFYPENIDPKLITPPIRVVVGRNVKLGSNLLNTSIAPTVVYTTATSIPQDWSLNKVQVVHVPVENSNDQINFEFVLKDLASKGVLQVLVEGGAKLGFSLLSNNMVDQLVYYQSPIILGSKGLSWSQIATSNTLEYAHENAFALYKSTTFGNDICIEYLKK